jgi:hypothetical protein
MLQLSCLLLLLSRERYGHYICIRPLLTSPDHIRPAPAAPRVAIQPSRHHCKKPCHLPCWPQTYQATAVRLSGKSGYSDDRMEGCACSCCLRSRLRPIYATMRPGLPPCPAGRSFVWTKNRSHCTFGRITTQYQLNGTSLRYFDLLAVSQSNT